MSTKRRRNLFAQEHYNTCDYSTAINDCYLW